MSVKNRDRMTLQSDYLSAKVKKGGGDKNEAQNGNRISIFSGETFFKCLYELFCGLFENVHCTLHNFLC